MKKMKRNMLTGFKESLPLLYPLGLLYYLIIYIFTKFFPNQSSLLWPSLIRELVHSCVFVYYNVL